MLAVEVQNLSHSINNKEINSTTEFIATLRTYSIGETVSIGLLREVDGELKQMFVETTLIEHVEYEGDSSLDYPDPNHLNKNPFDSERNLLDPEYRGPRNTITK